MKAWVYVGSPHLKLHDVPEPTTAAGEVIVEVAAVGICGSEIHGVTAPGGFRKPPLIMGHEFAGVRVDTGERVVVNPLAGCMRCASCLRGQVNVCRNRVIVGIQRPGAFAERLAVPEASCLPMPDEMSFIQGALIEPLANACHATRLAATRVPDPARVGVIGGGPIGFLSAFTARRRGALHVTVADRAADRRRIAVDSAADLVTNTLDGEYDVVYDSVGSTAARRASVAAIRPGGTAIWLGLADPGVDTDGLDFIRTEKSVVGSFCYSNDDFRYAAELVGDVPMTAVRVLPFDEGGAEFDRLVDGDVSALKSVLVFGPV